jgi:hypothetical protein
MLWWRWLLIGLMIAGGVLVVLYALHRLFLWMEGRGWLYYRKKRGSGGGASGVLTTMQQFVEPQVQHVIQMQEESKEHEQLEEGQPSQVDEPITPGPDTTNPKGRTDGPEDQSHGRPAGQARGS